MAKFKKARSTAGKTEAKGKAQTEQLAKTLGESAQQIWLAGMGAFGRAQAEGTKLFETLVKEGLNIEKTAKRFAGGRADLMRDVVEQRVGQARERATDTWDRLEKVFEDRVQRALVQLGVPGRDDLNALTDRVEALTAELRRQGAGSPRKGAAKKPPAKSATKKATRKAAAKKTVKKATAKRPAARKSAG